MDEKEKVLEEVTEEVTDAIEQENIIETEESAEVIVEEEIEKIDEVEELNEEEIEIEDIDVVEGINPEDETIAEAETPVKKKKLLEKSIIISIIIVGVAVFVLLAGLVLKSAGIIYDNTVVGAWNIVIEDTEEETNYKEYFVFEKDGTFKLVADSITYLGTWESTQTQNEDGATVSEVTFTYGGYYSSTFNYEVSGKPFQDRTLTLYDDSYQYNLVEVKSTASDNLKDVEVKVDNKLTGVWNNTENQITFMFDEDGNCSMNQYDAYLYEGVYAVGDEGTFAFNFSAYGELNTSDFTYSFDGDKLIIEELEFTRVED